MRQFALQGQQDQCNRVLRSRTYPEAKTFSICRSDNTSLRRLHRARSGKRLLQVASRRQIAPRSVNSEDSDSFEWTTESTSHDVRPARNVDAAPNELAFNDKTNANLQATPSRSFQGKPSSTEEYEQVWPAAKAEQQPHRRQPTARQTKRLREVTARKPQGGVRSVETTGGNCVLFKLEQPGHYSQKLGQRASSPSPNISKKESGNHLTTFRKFDSYGRHGGRAGYPNESRGAGVGNFLYEISKTKVLSKEEEVLLATHVQEHSRIARACQYFIKEEGREPSSIELCNLFSMEIEELELMRRTSRRAKQLLVEHNLKLVVSVAKKYIGRGVALEDIIQEGITGLIRGIEKFDPSRGFKLSTYTHWWIRQACTRAVNVQRRTIRLPVHVYDGLARINKMALQFEEENGRKPTREEVAKSIGLPNDRISILQISAYDVSSLDDAEYHTDVDGENMASPVATSDYSRVDDPLSICESHMLQEDLNAVLSTLAPRERNVLRMHYGLMASDGEEMTLNDIGNTYGLSRERIRQIESTAIDKLRHPMRALPLVEHMET